jgi:hypothetical protein
MINSLLTVNFITKGNAEMDNDVNVVPSYQKYFDMICVEDQEDVILVCETASKIIWEKFRAKFDDPKLLAVTVSVVYDQIKEKIKSLREKNSEFHINVCNRFEIGYTNDENEDDEKSGNFMIYIKPLTAADVEPSYESDDPYAKAAQRAVEWSSKNIIENSGILNDIAINAVKVLQQYKINIGLSELIFPVFIMTYESLVSYLKIKRSETKNYKEEINFISCFFIAARESLDGPDEIIIRPNIDTKILLKDDSMAGKDTEE